MDIEGSFVEIQGSFKGYTGLLQWISRALSIVIGGSLNGYGGLFECFDRSPSKSIQSVWYTHQKSPLYPFKEPSMTIRGLFQCLDNSCNGNTGEVCF